MSEHPTRQRRRPVIDANTVQAMAADAAPKLAQNAPAIERAPLRPELRDAADPRERAAQRAAQIRAQTGGSLDDSIDMFHVETSLQPPGWTYEWKTGSVQGQDWGQHIQSMRQQGWDYVPTSRHPQLMPHGSHDAHIHRKGMFLMERPTEIVDEARSLELTRARAPVRAKEAQLNSAPDGQFARNHPEVRAKISKSYEPMAIPKDG